MTKSDGRKEAINQMERRYLGIDVGTQGLKGVAIDPDGRAVWQDTIPYPTQTPRPGWNEQDPRDWERALITLLERADAAGLRFGAIGLSGQMHSGVFSDESGEPLHPAILWSDTRGGELASELVRDIGEEALWERFGNYPLVNYTLIKCLWLQRHEPEVWRRVRHLQVAKDWLRARMTGAYAGEVADASGTYLLSVRERRWDVGWIEARDIDPEWLGPVYESGHVTGVNRLGPQAYHDVPVVAGAGDQPASAVGTGVVASDMLGISLGTSGVVFWPRDRFQAPPHASIHAFCHALADRWYWMGVTQAAAYSLTWLHQQIGRGQSFADLSAEAEAAPPGSDALIFLPYLNGERAPIANPDARGVWLGLSSAHGRSHLIRSVLEGVAMSLYDVVLTMAGAELPARIVATGGGIKSALWAQILADVIGRPIDIVEDPGSAVGAARLAQASDDPSVLNRLEPIVSRTVDPDQGRIALYEDAFLRYRETYRRVAPLFRA